MARVATKQEEQTATPSALCSSLTKLPGCTPSKRGALQQRGCPGSHCLDTIHSLATLGSKMHSCHVPWAQILLLCFQKFAEHGRSTYRADPLRLQPLGPALKKSPAGLPVCSHGTVQRDLKVDSDADLIPQLGWNKRCLLQVLSEPHLHLSHCLRQLSQTAELRDVSTVELGEGF